MYTAGYGLSTPYRPILIDTINSSRIFMRHRIQF